MRLRTLGSGLGDLAKFLNGFSMCDTSFAPSPRLMRCDLVVQRISPQLGPAKEDKSVDVDKTALDWIVLYGPTLYMIVIAVIGTLFGWKKFFRVEKDRLGTPTKVYIGESPLVKVLFEVNAMMGVAGVAPGRRAWMETRWTKTR